MRPPVLSPWFVEISVRPSPRLLSIAFFGCIACLLTNAQVKRNETRALFPIGQNQRWGYINEQGRIVISPPFESAGEFSEDLARAEVGGDKYRMYGKWGFIDKTGRMVIAPQFGEAAGVSEQSLSFHEDLAMIEANYLKGFTGKTGQVVIRRNFNTATISLTVWRASKQRRIKSGNTLTVPAYERSSRSLITPAPFSDGLASVSINGVCGYIDRNGNFKLKPPFKPVGDDDCAVVHGHFNDGLS